MKKLFIIIALLLGFPAMPQSGRDRVMLQQIAALRTYGDYLQKGYRVVKDGLSFIGKVKDGELNLHTLFYDGLSSVSPIIRHYPKVQSIAQLSLDIEDVNAMIEQQLSSDLFYGNEKDYIRRVFERVLIGCRDDLEALQGLLSDTTLLSSDAQRLSRIDALYLSMEERYSFTKAFYDQCLGLLASRARELSGARQMRKLHNLNPAP